MPSSVEPDTEELVERTARGDQDARHKLFARHQKRLSQMIAMRMDRRLAARFDPADVLQESLIEADKKLADYLKERPIAFYPWLRKIAFERLVDLQRRHLSQKRSVTREEPAVPELPEDSVIELVGRLAGGTSPSRRVLREELFEKVRSAMAQLGARDRELLVLRHLEQLSTREIAATMGMTESAVKTRHFRSLERLRALLWQDRPEG